MEPRERSSWVPRALGALVVTILIVATVMTWLYSSALRDELVTFDRQPITRDIEVVTVGAGRITVARTAVTEVEGIWGVVGPNGYGQASAVIQMTDDTVERAFRALDGSFDVGELVGFDPIAYRGDPLEAHGIDFQEVRFTGDLGVYPAWVIDGDRDSWIIIVHGNGPGERAEALRIIPAFVAERYPVMVMTLRGDAGAPRTRTGRSGLGATEWRDVAAAVEYGLAQDADDFVLLGFDTGASTVAMFLHEADDITRVRGAVYDSPMLDPERVADRLAADRGLLAPLRGAGKLLAGIRFDIDWNQLDQVDRADEYTVPILVLQGTADPAAAVDAAAEFAAALGDLAEHEEFSGAQQGQLWNADPSRYQTSLLEFVGRVTAPPEG